VTYLYNAVLGLTIVGFNVPLDMLFQIRFMGHNDSTFRSNYSRV